MAGGFRVDLTALTQAAQGITDTLDTLATQKVSDIDGNHGALGHDRLADTVSDFCERWQVGVQNLGKDAQGVAEQLTNSVVAYQKVEEANHGLLNGILQSPTGPDPAAQ